MPLKVVDLGMNPAFLGIHRRGHKFDPCTAHNDYVSPLKGVYSHLCMGISIPQVIRVALTNLSWMIS